MQKAPGKGFLKVVGILMIIGNAIALLTNRLLSPGTGTATLSYYTSFYQTRTLISILLSAYVLFLGIMGVVNADKPERAKLMFILSVTYFAVAAFRIILVFTALRTLVYMIYMSLNSELPSAMVSFVANFAVVALAFVSLLSFAMPILFLVGAVKNKKAYKLYSNEADMN